MSTTVQTITQSTKAASTTTAAKKAWTVNFSMPAPKTMPAERLQARAELVRRAMTSGGGY